MKMTKDELKLNYEDILVAHGVINVGRYKVTETGQVLKMTKDELEKEAEEFTDSKKSFWRQGRTCIDSVKQAYIAGAEPREKRIAELKEDLRNKKLAIQNRNGRIKELEKKISVLLSCANCPENKGGYICEKEYEDKCLTQKIQYIKELQEEIAELRNNGFTVSAMTEQQLKVALEKGEQLEKENAELKKQLEMSNKVYNDNCDYSHHIEDQLTKAKELLKQWLQANICDSVVLFTDTKQFVKECEVGK